MLEGLGPSEDLVGALAGQASILSVAGRRDDAFAAAGRSLRMAAEQGYAVPYRALEALGLSRIANGDTGGLAEIKDALAALLELGQARDSAVTWLNYGFVLWQIEGPVAALDSLREAREYTDRRRLVELDQQISCTVLELMVETGELAEVVSSCRAQLDHPGPAFIMLRRIETLAALARAQLELGQEGAREAAEESYRLGIVAGWPDLLAVAGAPVATARAAAGERAGVREVLQRLLGLEELAGSHEFAARLPTFVRAALAVDEPGIAADLAARLVPLLPMWEYSATTAESLLAENRGDRTAAAAGFAKVAAHWKAFGSTLEHNYALQGLARCS
jgi:tetratricopeptide (TPR) repeat protein